MQIEEKIRRVLVFVLEIAAMILLYAVLNSTGIYKYIILSVVCLFILVVNYRKVHQVLSDWYLMIPILLYCGIGGILSICGGTLTLWTIKTMGFWLLPPIVSFLLCTVYEDNQKHMIDVQFYGCCLAYVFPILEWFLFGGGMSESTFAFPLGLFILYYAWQHRWIHMMIAAFFMYFADKRIATLAVIACAFMMIFMKLAKYSKKWVKALWGMVTAAGCLYIYSICSGLFEWFCIRLGIDTSHRLDVYPQIAAQIPDNYFLGKGLGTVNEMLPQILEPGLIDWFENPHNDLLKIFVELGGIGLVIFLLSYLAVFKIAEKRITQRALSQLFVIFAYFVLLMTTDNVSVYILFLVPMHSICLALAGEKKEIEHENYAK